VSAIGEWFTIVIYKLTWMEITPVYSYSLHYKYNITGHMCLALQEEHPNKQQMQKLKKKYCKLTSRA